MKLLFRADAPSCEGHWRIKLLLVMKMTVILLTVACLQICAKTHAQIISLSVKDAPLEKVFKEIQRQTGYAFVYTNDDLSQTQPVTLTIQSASIDKVLQLCLNNQPLLFSITDRIVVIKRKEKVPPATVSSIDVKGTVTNEKGEPLAGATISIKGTSRSVTTSEAGVFILAGTDNNTIIIVSSVSFESQEIKINGRTDIMIRLKMKEKKLDSVVVTYNTGYQYIPKERATGSFAHIDNTLLNRSVSTNILDRLNGVASGVLFDGNTGTSNGFSVRGRSTIFASADPLIVLNNFPYDGDLSTINPNDVESITILKDAAAASIWGARASNGVVVITTKKGRFNQSIHVSFNSNVTIGQQPDLYGRPDMSTGDIIDVEKFLYANGQYAGYVWTPYVAPSPVVAILEKQTQGLLTEAQANARIDDLRNLSNKDDLLKYYYRNAVNQQYSLNVNGGGEYNKYYLSVGYDRTLPNIRSNSSDRLTINADNVYSIFKNKLEISTGINFSVSKSKTNGTGTFVNRPYEMLADDEGRPLNFNFYRQEWTDTIGAGHLLDWQLKPLDEIRSANNKSELTNYILNTGIKYKIIKGLDASILYQYSKGITENKFLNPLSSFTARNQINSFSQVDYNTGNVSRAVPSGDILYLSNISYQSHNIRGQISYSNTWSAEHSISAIAGSEMKTYNAETNTHSLYGYEKETGQVVPVNYAAEYPQIFYSWATGFIPGSPTQSGISDRYLSYFANIAYTYSGKHTASVSARKDESNLFGVKANQKGVPLWSLGYSWQLSKEKFYHVTWLPDLRLRATTGYNGNVDKSVSAYTTIQSDGANVFNDLQAFLVNPPNPSLRWEKINITNIGIDFGAFQNDINGSIEYYFKRGKDLLGYSPLAPQTGVTQFKGNAADLKGKGIDLVIHTNNIKGIIQWQSSLLFSYNTDKITNYKVATSPLGFHQGYSYSSLFSYKWGGLDNTGDPLGYIGKQTSKAWGTIVNTDSIGNSTIYNGRNIPSYFGSLRNTIGWKNISFSFNILYKMGYYFRASTINYSNLFSQLSGHKDYSLRWQQPGDENNTYVPAMVYAQDYNREQFYTNAAIHIQKASQIRLQDIQVSYSFSGKKMQNAPFSSVNVYLYANNLGIIWKANKKGIDPDYQDIPAQKNISIGLKADF